MHYGALNNNPNLPKGIIPSSSRRNNTNNPPTQNQQISKSTVYSCCTIKYSVQHEYTVLLLICWFCVGGLLVLFLREELDMMFLGKLGLLFNAP